MKREEYLKEAVRNDCKVYEAVLSVKTDRTVYALNRIYRYDHCPTFSDVELGRKAIVNIAAEMLIKSCKRIQFINSRIYSETGENLLSVRKKVEQMSLAEKLAMFNEYRRLDWLVINTPEKNEQI